MPTASKKRLAYIKQWSIDNRERKLATIARWKRDNPERVKFSNQKSNLVVKIEVLCHYGKGGLHVCRWRGCKVADLDMLTLDHILNDGAQHRGERGKGWTGVDIYRKLRALGFPTGFQTLCWNHQWKKELARRRS